MHIIGYKRGTQQENSYMKQTVTNRLPLTATLGRVKEASHWNVYWANGIARSFRRK
jgi:hypothetical protein